MSEQNKTNKEQRPEEKVVSYQVKMLLDAENRAKAIIQEAQERRERRIRQALNEADQEIQVFREVGFI